MRYHLSFMSWYWLGWLLAFIIPELYFVLVAPAVSVSGTLSDTVWALEDLSVKQPFDFAMWTDVHWAIAALVWTLFAWLSIHLPFGLL